MLSYKPMQPQALGITLSSHYSKMASNGYLSGENMLCIYRENDAVLIGEISPSQVIRYRSEEERVCVCACVHDHVTRAQATVVQSVSEMEIIFCNV